MKALVHKTKKTLDGGLLYGKLNADHSGRWHVDANAQLNICQDLYYNASIESLSKFYSVDLSDYNLVQLEIKPIIQEPIGEEIEKSALEFWKDNNIGYIPFIWNAAINWYKKQIGR